MCSCIAGTTTTMHKRANHELVQIPADILGNTVGVDLSFNKINYLRRTTFIEYQRCSQLDLHCNYIEEIEIGAFSSFINIEMLRLDHNNLQYIKLGYFTGLQSLRTLSLGYNQITDIFKGSFDTLLRLKSLFLSGNFFTSISSNMLKGLNSLEYLYIGHNKIRKIKDFAFKHLTSLKLIYLRNNFLTRIKKNVWIGLHSLEDLNLSSNEIISIEQEAFHDIWNLKQLCLAHNKLLNFEAYASWSVNLLVNIDLRSHPLMNLTFTQDNNFQNIYTKEISLLRALKRERRKVEERNLIIYQKEKELKDLKEILDKTRKECGDTEDEFQKFIEERRQELERRSMRYLQDKFSEFWENLRNRFNWNRYNHERDDTNRQEIRETSMLKTIIRMFRGSAELVYRALVSGVAFVLVFVGTMAIYLLLSVGRLLNLNLDLNRR